MAVPLPSLRTEKKEETHYPWPLFRGNSLRIMSAVAQTLHLDISIKSKVQTAEKLHLKNEF